MKIKSFVTKTFKYMSYLLLVLISVVLSFLLYILHTESGSRFAINQGIKLADIEVTYGDLEGNLSDGLVINNLRYEDQTIELKVKKISYHSKWSWFSRHVELSDIGIDEVNLRLKAGSNENDQGQAFTGFELPLTLDVKQLYLNELNVTTAQESQTIDSVELSALLEKSNVAISTLRVVGSDYNLLTQGVINYHSGLSYDLDTTWQLEFAESRIQGSGVVNGDLLALHLKQGLVVDTEVIQGDFNLQGDIKNFTETAEFILKVSADESNVLFNEESLQLQNLTADVTGQIDNYRLSLKSKLIQETWLAGKLPPSQLQLEATGDSQQLNINAANISTSDGSIGLTATMNWQDLFALSSHIQLEKFNPQLLLEDWPGIVNGELDFKLNQTAHGVVIGIDQQSLNGQLKGQDFALSGSVDYTAETLTAKQLKLDLGDNHLLINGQIIQQNVALDVVIDWVDLSLLDKQLSGTVEGSVGFSGDYQKPLLLAELTAQNLVFKDYQINQLAINSSGTWGESIESEFDVDDANLAGQQFNNIQIQQTGWLNEHEVKLLLDADEFSSNITLTGQIKPGLSTNNRATWQGQINKHELIIDKDQRIRLQKPINVVVAEHISLSPGCWQGVEAGVLCVSLNDIKETENKYQGSLTLEAFSLIPLQMFLPEGIEIKGKLHGDADFLYQDDNLDVTSNLQLEQGELLLKNKDLLVYQSDIENFTVKAQTNKQNIVVSLNAVLADQSNLQLEAKLDKANDQDWLIKSTINGVFNNSQILTALSEEINQSEGQITMVGSIQGALNQPNINLTLNQVEGFITLTRLGTVLEQLKLSVATQGIKQPIYQIQFTGHNLASINQGHIASQGTLSMTPEQQWQYRGDITGDNFMLLNLPEAKFNVSPKLAVIADQHSTDIKGELGIDYGHVVVKQLPASGISNSADLEIHTTESSKSVAYPISMNVRANINQPIALDVIGLVAELTGSIQLNQTKEQSLLGTGVLNLNKGSYEIYGQKLDINEGELTFTGPLDNPRLKVKASRKSISGDVVAGVELGGTVNNLQSKLYSEPSLSDIEKLSYIMTGRGIDNSGSLNGDQLKQAAIVMGLNQSSPIFSQIQNQFGIDVLTVKESAVAADTVVEAGKKINDKLYVSYNQGLFNRLGFWVLKYRINQFLNLQTTQGEDQSIELVYTRKADVNKKKED